MARVQRPLAIVSNNSAAVISVFLEFYNLRASVDHIRTNQLRRLTAQTESLSAHQAATALDAALGTVRSSVTHLPAARLSPETPAELAQAVEIASSCTLATRFPWKSALMSSDAAAGPSRDLRRQPTVTVISGDGSFRSSRNYCKELK